MAQTILVTGGAGYIGSHTCKALARAGFVPVTYDSLERGHDRAVKWGPLEIGNLCERDRLDAVIRRHRPAGVIHFAAYAYVGESVEKPDLYYRNNLGGTLVLLDALREAAVDCLVFSSTCAIYGTPDRLPITETQPYRPINPYGRTKLMIEQILDDYRQAFGFRSYALRYFNAAGADPEGDIGESHTPETHLIPLVLDAAAGVTPHITVLGDDYPTPDGTCIRDYVHVSDLADAHVAALTRLLAGDKGGSLNLGTGTGHSVRDVIAAAAAITQKKIPIMMGPRRPGDPPELVADPSRAKEVLSWQAQRSGLDQLIADAWRWHCAQLDA
jgi:UDP-arabinose 4-epimerase